MIKNRSGFTLIELMITMIVIVILTALSIVVIGNIQAQARDKERKSDIETIARGIEQYYKQGNPYVKGRNTSGGYPGGLDMVHMLGRDYCVDSQIKPTFDPCSGGRIEVGLPGVTQAAITPPGSNLQYTGLLVDGNLATNSYGDSQVAARIDEGYYMYKPYLRDETCLGNFVQTTDRCTSYTLRYKEETTGQIITVKSKRQQ